MDNHFVGIADKESFAALLKQSAEKPVVVFKHSTTCPISAGAYEEMTAVECAVNIVTVQTAREVSDEIEVQTGIEHHSPQVIVLRNGKAVWNTSHWKVKAEAVAVALREAE